MKIIKSLTGKHRMLRGMREPNQCLSHSVRQYHPEAVLRHKVKAHPLKFVTQ